MRDSLCCESLMGLLCDFHQTLTGVSCESFMRGDFLKSLTGVSGESYESDSHETPMRVIVGVSCESRMSTYDKNVWHCYFPC